MASLLSNGRKSRLDMPIGIDESRAAQAQDRADRNTVLALKANKTDIRLGRRAYRAAIRGGDVGAISALPILEKMRAVTGTTGGGVQMANTLQPAVEKKIQHTREQIDSFGNKTLDDNGKLAPRQQSRILGNGSGLTPQDAKTSSNGGEWVDVSGKPMATTLEVRGAAPSAAPLVKPSGNSLAASAGGYRPGLSARIGALQAKWQNEARANDPAFQQEAYEARYGAPAQQALNDTGRNQQPEFAGPPAPEGYSAQPSSRLFSPEETRQLRRVVGLFGPNRANGDESQIRGEIAAGDTINAVRNTSLSDVSGAIQGGVGAIVSRLMPGVDAGRSQLGRLLNAPSPVAAASSLLSPGRIAGGLNVQFDTPENRRFAESYNDARKYNESIAKSPLLNNSILGSMLRRDPRSQISDPKKAPKKNIFGF